MSLRDAFRDSWEVWRRKVDTALGGSVEDIKASEVTFDGTTSSLSATNVQSAIDEVAGNIPEIPTSYAASAITYDNTTSGLEATDAQSAIDELDGKLDELDAGDVGYNNTTSGLEATNVQTAIDEVSALLNKLTGFYIISPTRSVIEVEADGVKTNSELMVEITTALNTYLATLDDDEGIVLEGTNLGDASNGAFMPTPMRVFTKTVPIDMVRFLSTIGSGTTITSYTVTIAPVAGNIQYLEQKAETGGTITRTDKSSTVPTSGSKVVIYYRVVKIL